MARLKEQITENIVNINIKLFKIVLVNFDRIKYNAAHSCDFEEKYSEYV